MPTATSPARPAKRGRVQTPEGVITAVVAVTGVKDHVDDVIVPGSFARTFAIRRPKVVFHHDWLRFLGRSLSYVELMPGDPRLPKRTKEGKPWPKDAGAVVAVMQFNLNVDAGRDGYEWARFYTESNECEWSIGYKVVPGKASKGRDGVRYIYDLDVYEFSLVLFGAASLSMTMDVKALEGHDDLEAKAVPFGAQLLDQVLAEFQREALETKAAESMVNSGVMVALYPPAEVAQQLAVADGTGAEDLHVTLAYLGHAEDLPGTAEDLADVVRQALVDTGPLSGIVGGLGQFAAGDNGTPVYVPVDVPDLGRVREGIVDAIEASPFSPQFHRDHGFTPHMTLGYDVDAEPVPSTDVAFGAVHVVVGPDRIEIPLGGELPSVEVKAAAAAVLEARQVLATTGHSAFDAVREAKYLTEGTGGPERGPRRGGVGGPVAARKPAARPTAAPVRPATARKPAVRAAAGGPAGDSTFDEEKHPRAKKGEPNGGQFIAKGSGYQSTGREDEAPDVTKAQEALIEAGMLGEQDGKDGRGDDGYYGRKTEAAVKKWQTKMGYEPTGKLSGDQFDELTGDSMTSGGRRRRGGRDEDGDDDAPAGRRGRGRGRRRRPRQDEDDLDGQGRRKYLPNGDRNPEYAKARGVATVTGPRNRPMPTDPPKGNAAGGKPMGRGSGYSSTGRSAEAGEVKKAQAALIAAGMLGKGDGKDGKGDDGLYGRKTEAAVRKWQTTMGYEPDGKLTRDQLAELTGGKKKAPAEATGATPGRKPAAVPAPGFGKRKPGPAPAAGTPQPVGRPKRAFGDRTSDRSRLQTKSAWDTVMEAKYDTSSSASPGRDNWIEQIDGELDPFIRAVRNALMRERGKSEQEAHEIAIGTIRRWAAGGGEVTAKTRAKATKAIAAWEALKAKAHATPPMEGKAMFHEIPGSYEAIRDQLRVAAQDLFKDKQPKRDGDEVGAGMVDHGCYVSVEATYPTHVIVSHEQGGKPTTYQVPYTAGPDGVTLGTPEEVSLRVVVEDSGVDAAEDETAMVRFAQPAAGLLEEATALVMLGGAEGKSAQVLRPALLALMDALAMKGMPDVHADEEDDFLSQPADDADDAEADEDEGDDTPLLVVRDNDPTAAEPLPEQLVDEPAEDELADDLEEKGLVLLDLDEVTRQLEALRL